MLLEKIQSPKDVKKLSLDQLNSLAQEARQALMTKVAAKGGHFGPPMGAADMIIALHYVFNSPQDKIVYDVSHQSYVHKMLTGRAQAFLDPNHYNDVTGYTDPNESEHDFFNIGHTSTSVSLATGLAKGRDLLGQDHNVIALIGDGSLSGGEAFEGLDVAATLGSNMIIIVNDNDQSIAENQGGIYEGLRRLRETNSQGEDNLFKAMGLDYRFVKEGNDIGTLIEAFQAVKDIDHPIVLHVATQKGKGYALAEEKANHERYHYMMPFDLETGEFTSIPEGKPYASIIADYLGKAIQEDPSVVALVAGTPSGFFPPAWREAAGSQYVDVGIAEEQAVAMISGLAKAGAKPVFSVYSTFLQRTFDQLVQDLCVNANGAVILNHMASVYGMNDVTHLGFFDIPMTAGIPNLVYLAPTNQEELLAMLDWAMKQEQHPVMIRIPVDQVQSCGHADRTDYSQLNTFQVTKKGSRVALIGLGNFYRRACELAEELAKEGIEATLINPKFISGIDKALLESLKDDHQLVVTLEDGILDGGFGQRIASFYGPSDMKVKNYGIRKAFHDRYDPDQLLADDGCTVPQMLADIKKLLL